MQQVRQDLEVQQQQMPGYRLQRKRSALPRLAMQQMRKDLEMQQQQVHESELPVTA
jgi:hypothetical protein